MITFENIQEYTEWIVKQADKLGKYSMTMVEIKNIRKKFCICGSPLAIEGMAEEGAEKFVEQWNDCMRGDDEHIDKEVDVDLISVIRDGIIEALERHKNMVFVYVSTEY